MPCCLCKGAGKCVRCTCALAGVDCTDCYPSRAISSHCSNAKSQFSSSSLNFSLSSFSGDRPSTRGISKHRFSRTSGENKDDFTTNTSCSQTSTSCDPPPSDSYPTSLEVILPDARVHNGNTAVYADDDGICRSHASAIHLPPFQARSSPTFMWAEKPGAQIARLLQEIRLEIVHWRPNLLEVPLGARGTKIVGRKCSSNFGIREWLGSRDCGDGCANGYA